MTDSKGFSGLLVDLRALGEMSEYRYSQQSD